MATIQLTTGSTTKSAKQAKTKWKGIQVHAAQFLVLVIFLLIWQYSPDVGFIHNAIHWDGPFFISSPSLVAIALYHFATGTHGVKPIWPALWNTLFAAAVGCVVGLLLGAICGLVMSHYDFASRVGSPFIAAGNAIPRIALIPIVLLIAGPTELTCVINAILVVFFLGFFNAFRGGQSVPPHVMENARVMKATPLQLMFRIRLPYVTIWTFAAVPNGIGFALTAVVATEILTGITGMGDLILLASDSLDATTVFAVVIVLAVVGAVVYLLADRLSKRILHWHFAELNS